MDQKRLIALHRLSLMTGIVGVLAVCLNWILALAIVPLHVYLAVHGARAAGVGRMAAAGIALAATLPLANTLVLFLVGNRLVPTMLAAGVPPEEIGFSSWRRP